jgi:hypothetical protein
LTNHAEEMLQRGSVLLAPVLLGHGFSFKILEAGGGSGGHFASGEFKRGTRRLQFHFRHSLGIVTYSLADRSMTHQQYMRSVQGGVEASNYPGFSDDPLDAFRHLLLDLEQHGSDFLSGTDERLLRCIDEALAMPKTRTGPPT